MQHTNKIHVIVKFFFFISLVFSTDICGKCETIQSLFTTSETIVCGPGSKSISFTNVSTGSEASSATYSWFMNGVVFDNTSGLALPQNASISDVGAYTFMLIATDKTGCKDTSMVTVFIRPVPVANFTINGTVCSGTTLDFKSMSSGTGSYTTYSWDFGDGKKSTIANPVHTYNAVNNYVVALTVSNGEGCTNTYRDTVTLSEAPQPMIEGKDKDGDTRYCLLENDDSTTDTVVFTNSSKNAQSFRWDFGDGTGLYTTGSTDPITHIYSNFGVFKVTMIAVSSQNCEKSTTLTVIFNKAPKASFALQASELSGCLPHTVTPANTTLYAGEYTWNFGDGTPVVTTYNATPFNHIYKKAGQYVIVLKAANSCNTSTFSSDTIVVRNLPDAKFDATPLSGCAPLSITFNNLTTAAADNIYRWNFGDGTVWEGSANPGNKIYEQGIWKIQLTVSNACGKDSMSRQLNILAPPAPPVVSEKTICSGTSAELIINVPQGTYEWFDAPVNGKLLASGPQFSTPVLTSSVTYYVQRKSGNCVSTRVPVKVNVLPLPIVPAISDVTICKGSIAILKITQPGKYEWYNSPTGGICLDTTDTFATPPLYTNIEYYVQVKAGACKSLRSMVKVVVSPPPQVNYKTDTVCLGDTTRFMDLSTGGPRNWLWDFGDGKISRNGPVVFHSYLRAGAFIAKLIVADSIGCSDSLLQAVIVNAPISLQITAKDSACTLESIVFENNSVKGTDSVVYSDWDFGDGSPVLNGLKVDHVFEGTGSFTVQHTIVSAKGCRSNANQHIYIAPLPVAGFTSVNTCQVQASIFRDQSTTDVVSWKWNFGDHTESADQHPLHAYAESGYYQVSLWVRTGLGCEDTVSQRIFVYRQPKAAFTADTVCWGDSTAFRNTSLSVDGNIDQVFWNFGDGSFSSEFEPRHSFLMQKDSFLVTLTIRTTHGCNDTFALPVRTHPLPVFNFFPTEKVGCVDFTTAFIDSSKVSAGKITSWLWDFGDGNLTYRRYPIHTFTTPGNFYVKLILTTSNGCQVGRKLTYPIVVRPKPSAAFDALPGEVSIDQATVQFINTSENGIMWDWNFGDHKTSVNENNFHTYKDTGTFVVTLIAINEYGCYDTTYRNVRVNAQPQIYIPNAFSPDGDNLNDVFLPAGNGIQAFQMIIVDRWGKVVFKTEDVGNGWNGRLDNTGELLPEGLYVYKMQIKDVLQIIHNYTGSVFITRKW